MWGPRLVSWGELGTGGPLAGPGLGAAHGGQGESQLCPSHVALLLLGQELGLAWQWGREPGEALARGPQAVHWPLGASVSSPGGGARPWRASGAPEEAGSVQASMEQHVLCVVARGGRHTPVC